jgi:hypothetical protein
MRQFTILAAVLLFAVFALGQAAVVSGSASNRVPAYGYYAAPFVPLVITPSLSLSTFSPSPVGASNATAGLVAGATNATLSLPVDTPSVVTEANWYDYDAAGEAPVQRAVPARHWAESEMKGEHANRPMRLGIAQFQSSIGAAELAADSRAGKRASRTYTNADVERMNQNNGSVRWDHKEEKL